MARNTIAQQVAAELGHDGTRFESEGGVSLGALCVGRGAQMYYGRRRTDPGTGWESFEAVDPGEPYDRVRWLFPDRSAIVIEGDRWDIEGAQPFSW